MKKLVKIILAFTIPGTLLISSCKKDNAEVNPKNQPENIEVYSSVESDINSLDQAIDDAQEENSNLRKGPKCYTVTYASDTTSPLPGFEVKYRKFTLTFTGTCDSLSRTGQVIVYKSGSWITGNYKDSVIFSGYSIDGRGVSGFRSRSLSTSSDLKNLVFSYSNSLTITLANGQTIKHQASGKKTFVNYLVPLLSHIEITGQGSYLHADGNLVSYTITKPIILNGSCQRKYRFPVEGSIAYTNTATSKNTIVDYGDGQCDKIATISINNGPVTTFKMK